MSPTVHQLLDTDESTVLFDLNDPTGSNNPNSTKTYFGLGGAFNLGVPATELVQFAPDSSPGGFTLNTRDPLVQSSWLTRFVPLTYDALIADLGFLANLLRQGCAMKWVANGSTLTKLIDVEPTPAPVLYRGDALELLKVQTLLDVTQGVQFAVWRQPSLRGTALDTNTNLVANPLMLADVGATGRPDGWGWSSTTNITSESIDPAKDAYKFNIATTGTRTLASGIVAGIAPGDFLSGQMEMFASDGVTAKAALQITFYQTDGTTVTGTSTATAQTLNGTPRLFTLTSTAAPALTAKAKLQVVFTNSAATGVNVWLRRGMLEKSSIPSLFRGSTEVMTNDPTTPRGLWTFAYVQGDLPTPASVRIVSPDASAKLDSVVIAAKASHGVVGRNALAALGSKAAVMQGESGTLGTDTSSVADANGSGGNVAECTFATPSMLRRTRNTIATNMASLAGRWDVWVRVKNTTAGKVGLLGKWVASSEDPAPYIIGTEVYHDTTNAGTFHYVWKNLGSVQIPLAPPPSFGAILPNSVTFEVWAERLSGTPSLRVDLIVLVPADDPYSQLTVQDGGTEIWRGDQLLTPVTSPASGTGDITDSGLLVLNANNEAGGTPPNTGRVWGVARHIVTADISIYRPDKQKTKSGELRVRNVTDGTNTVVIDITPTKKTAWNRLNFQAMFDGVAAKAYQIQVWMTVASGAVIDVHSISKQTLNYAAQNQVIASAPWPPTAQLLDSSNNVLQSLGVSGAVPMWLEPGLNAIYVHTGDNPDPGYNEDNATLGRTWSLDIIHSPRWRY